MTAEIALYVATTAFLFNIMVTIVMCRLHKQHSRSMERMFARINYLEFGMSFHQLVPLPWEMENFEEEHEEIKVFKREGNVVYLQDE